VTANVEEGSVEVDQIGKTGISRQAEIRSGSAVVSRLDPKTYTVMVFAKGFRPAEKTIPIKSGEEASIQFTLERVMTSALDPELKRKICKPRNVSVEKKLQRFCARAYAAVRIILSAVTA
jgi:hypothetical protein